MFEPTSIPAYQVGHIFLFPGSLLNGSQLVP